MYHLSNVLLLGLIACMLYLLLKRFLIPPKLALLSTLIYCAHPLFVSFVAWIPARGDLLLTLFSLLSFLLFIDYLRKKKTAYLIFHWVTFTIALFCKETAAFLPFLFILYFFTFSSGEYHWKKILYIIPLYIVSGVFWLWMRPGAIQDVSIWNNVLGAFGKDKIIGLTPFLLNLRTIPESLAGFFIPVNIAPIPGFSLSRTLIGAGIIAIIIFLFFRNPERSKKEKLFCFAWFLLTIIPTMLVKVKVIDYLDHRFFLPLIGILLFVLFSLPKKWFEKGDIKKPWIMVAVFLILSVFTFINSRAYSDPMTFDNSAISKNPDSALAYNNRGALYHKRGLLDRAVSDYTKAIHIQPDYVNPYNARANAYYLQKNYAKAIADFSKVIELKAADANTYNTRGASYLHLGLYEKACPDFEKAEELGSKSATINLARFCGKTTRH